MSSHARSPEMLRPLLAALTVLICALLFSPFPQVGFVPEPTAFEWPTADQFFSLERALDPNFVPNDFTTNSTSDISPRMFHTKLILGLANLFNTDYYSVVFCMKQVYMALLPAMLFWLLAGIPLGKNDQGSLRTVKYVVIAVGVGLCQWPPLIEYIRFAFWRPLPYWGAAQATTYVFALSAWLILQNSKHPLAYALGGFLLLCATLLHGANTIFICGFMLIASGSLAEFKKRLLLIAVCVLPAAVLTDLFLGSDVHLPGKQFVEMYVTEAPCHRHHYLPEVYDKKPMLRVLVLCGLFGVLALLLRSRRLFYLAAVFAGTYWGAYALQYIAIYLMPNRSLTLLGPVRYTQMGYFMLVLLAAGIALELLARFRIKVHTRLPSAFVSRAVGIFAIALIAVCVVQQSRQVDDPVPTFRAMHKPLFDWIDANTKPQDVFAVPVDEGWQFTLMTTMVARRATYFAGYMAFNDKYFAETTERKNLIYGSYKEWRELNTTQSKFYCSILDTARIRKAASVYPLQWLIMPNSCMDARLDGLPVAFKGEKFSIVGVQP